MFRRVTWRLLRLIKISLRRLLSTFKVNLLSSGTVSSCRNFSKHYDGQSDLQLIEYMKERLVQY